MLLHRVVYVSSAARPFSRPELRALHILSRRANAARQLTGMLLHKGAVFVQAIEGERGTVHAVIERIAADARHRGMRVLSDQPASERAFAGWPLGFTDLDQAAPEALAGHPAFPADDGTALAADPMAAFHLLLSFKALVQA